MVRNVFHLDDRPLTSLMVSRGEIEWLDAHQTVAEALDYVAGRGQKNAHSWYPVSRGSLDEVVGIISVAHLLELGQQSDELLEAHVTPAAFVPETLSAMEMLEQLRTKSGRLVFIVDEYGVVQGLMTPHDLLEAITGELKSDAHIDPWARQHEDGTWILAGSFLFSSVMNYFLATWIVTSPSGTTAFNEELGWLTLLSYPMIALPSMLIMAAALYYLVRTIHTLAGLKLTDALKH